MSQKNMPAVPTMKNNYINNTNGSKEQIDYKAKTQAQEAFINQGNAKPGDLEGSNTPPAKLGFFLSGAQKDLLNQLQKVYPKKPGKKLSFSFQDYISEALSLKLKIDCEKHGIPYRDI